MHLPPFEHSYETIIHKNVYFSHLLIIPDGISSYIWINHRGVSLLYGTTCQNIICSVNPILKNEYGTLFYGTLFQSNGLTLFAIEDLLYYKGKNISKQSFERKLIILKNILQTEIQQQPTNDPNEVIIGLPIITQQLNHSNMKQLPYTIKYIQFRNNNKQQGNHRFQLPYDKLYRTMIVHADISHDIYYLTDDTGYQHGIACIPDYHTSVYMNKLFRNIKENDNLDLIEESDDEEDLTSPSTFVDLNKSCRIQCYFHIRFKKWVPFI